jgi:hypothetical protein
MRTSRLEDKATYRWLPCSSLFRTSANRKSRDSILFCFWQVSRARKASVFGIRNAFPSAVALFLLSELAAIVGLSGGAQLRVFSQQILAGNVPGVAQALKIHSRELSQSGLRLVENLVLTLFYIVEYQEFTGKGLM